MEEELRRVAGIVLRAPLTRRTGRELLYCGIGGLAGVAGFWITVILLTGGFTVSAPSSAPSSACCLSPSRCGSPGGSGHSTAA